MESMVTNYNGLGIIQVSEVIKFYTVIQCPISNRKCWCSIRVCFRTSFKRNEKLRILNVCKIYQKMEPGYLIGIFPNNSVLESN